MGGTFSSINIGLSGMISSQTGLNVTGQNIANANVEGYTRKTVHQQEPAIKQSPFTVSKDGLFNGTQVVAISRARDSFLDGQFRTQNSATGFAEEVSKATVSMNDILGEPSDNGIAANLNSFFEATSDLAANPELGTAKTVFVNAARSLSDTFNQIDAAVNNLRTSMDKLPNGKIPLAIDDLNSKLDVLAQTHRDILAGEAGGHDTTTLEDRRDLLLDQISGLLDVNIERDEGGNFIRVSLNTHPAEAKVVSANQFSNHDAAIVPAIGAGNNTLDISVNNGSGNVIGPITVNFDNNSSIRDVVTKINQSFQAAGGQGSIASLDNNDRLVIETSLIKGSQNSAAAAVNIIGGNSLAGLGLAVGVTNGSAPEKQILVDSKGLAFKFQMEQGNNKIASNPAKLSLVTNDPLQTKVGTLHNFSGSIGGLYEVTNIEIPEMQSQLDGLALNIKDSVNSVLQLGTTTTGNPGSALFTGSDAGSLQVDPAVTANPSLISAGKSSSVSDGAIANEISKLFFENQTIISNGATAEKLYIDSPSAAASLSSMPIIPGGQITITADGTVDDNGSTVNAGTNGFGGGSLVQIEFLDANGVVIGGPIDFPPSSGPPEDSVTFAGAVPAGAAFVQLRMNNTTFNDNDLSNNTGHFGISIFQGTENNVSTNFTDGFASVTGDFGTRASFANSRLESSSTLRESIDNNRKSISGVSLEEEAANLIQYQNAFSANARVLSVVDQVIQEILGLV